MKATFITGKSTLAKNSAAQPFLKGKQAYLIDGNELVKLSKDLAKQVIRERFTWGVPHETEVIKVADFPTRHLDFLFEFLRNETILAEPFDAPGKEISPEVVVLCSGDLSRLRVTPSTARNFDFIHLS